MRTSLQGTPKIRVAYERRTGGTRVWNTIEKNVTTCKWKYAYRATRTETDGRIRFRKMRTVTEASVLRRRETAVIRWWRWRREPKIIIVSVVIAVRDACSGTAVRVTRPRVLVVVFRVYWIFDGFLLTSEKTGRENRPIAKHSRVQNRRQLHEAKRSTR